MLFSLCGFYSGVSGLRTRATVLFFGLLAPLEDNVTRLIPRVWPRSAGDKYARLNVQLYVQSPANAQSLPGYVRRFIRGQECHSGCDIGRLSLAFERDCFQKGLLCLL